MPETLTVAAMRRILDGNGVPNGAKLLVRMPGTGREVEVAGVIGYKRGAQGAITAIVIHLLDYPRRGLGLGLGATGR